MVEVPIFAKLRYRKSSPNPGICLDATSSRASGVTSRAVSPVPPVEMMISTELSFIQCWSFETMRFLSSVTISIAARL